MFKIQEILYQKITRLIQQKVFMIISVSLKVGNRKQKSEKINITIQKVGISCKI